jgi:hypothetical protein
LDHSRAAPIQMQKINERRMHPIAKTARIAGAVYLSTLPLAVYFWTYLPGKLIVPGNAALSGEQILAHETVFRVSIVGDLFTHLVLLCLAFLLYRLLSGLNRGWALVMVGLVLVSTAVGFLNTLNSIAAVILFRGADFLAAIDEAQRDALGMFFIRLHSQGFYVNEVLSGLWLFPLGLLVVRSGFVPRLLGVWLLIAGFGWLFLSVIALVFPTYYDIAFRFAQPVVLGEMAFALWLLIKGPMSKPSAQAVRPTAR